MWEANKENSQGWLMLDKMDNLLISFCMFRLALLSVIELPLEADCFSHSVSCEQHFFVSWSPCRCLVIQASLFCCHFNAVFQTWTQVRDSVKRYTEFLFKCYTRLCRFQGCRKAVLVTLHHLTALYNSFLPSLVPPRGLAGESHWVESFRHCGSGKTLCSICAF